MSGYWSNRLIRFTARKLKVLDRWIEVREEMRGEYVGMSASELWRASWGRVLKENPHLVEEAEHYRLAYRAKERKRRDDEAAREALASRVSAEAIRPESMLDVSSEEFRSLSAAPLEVLNWVAANIALSDPRVGECPSPLAWRLLGWIKSSPANEREFWTGIWPRTLPSRSEVSKVPQGGEDEVDAELGRLLGEMASWDVVQDEVDKL